jgi:hypothetical protein
MTDRLKGCWVSFDQDIGTDDAESILGAIRMIRGVAAVETSVTDPEDWLARQRIRFEIKEKIAKFYDSI